MVALCQESPHDYGKEPDVTFFFRHWRENSLYVASAGPQHPDFGRFRGPAHGLSLITVILHPAWWGRNHVNWLFFSFSGVDVCFLGFLLLPTSLFSEPTEGIIAKTFLAQDHSAPAEVDIGLSGILKLAGPDCLFEKTLHDTFLISLIGLLKNNQLWSKQRKKKRHSTSRRNNKAGSTGVVKQGTYGQIWHCHA